MVIWHSFPSDIEWSPADLIAASDEGWGIFDADGSSNGRTQLQCCDETGTFNSDAEAWAYVRTKARQGSSLHVRALDVIAKHNPVERQAIEEG